MGERGRHRRPQTGATNRAALAVTASGAGLALPFVAAGSAGAATIDTWDAVASCESDNNWQINSGNGFYGGLQFTQSTWREYGGTVYAARADLATKSQQVAVAEKVLKGQGPGAWPICSKKAGLARGGPAPDLEGRTQVGAGTPKATPSAKPSASASPRASATPTPKPKVTLREEPAPRKTATPTPTDTTVLPNPYVVAPGDSLSAIAVDQRVEGGWQALYETNRSTVGADPNLIFPGQRLTLRVTIGGNVKDGGASPGKGGTGAKPGTGTGTGSGAKPTPSATPSPSSTPSPSASATPKAKPSPTATKSATPRATPTKEQVKPQGGSSAGWVSPVADESIGTGYKVSGSHWSSGYHTGVDFPVPTGTTVRAVGPGTVVTAGWSDAYGYQVVIRHADGRYSQYAHLSALSIGSGQSVSAGQRLGRSGATGNVTGPHLHFEIRTGPGYGSDVNPLSYLRGHGVGI
ncbi:transglycosylase family protein [Streptomyces sp. BI20]|uniref:transglycosylase family protein n=1 Tax=Streptomyces sp. BI20 TaxID=3403460 RepID=UPI003C775585